MKREDLISGIKPPKFKVGRYVLNEYEAREMVARIAEGSPNPDGIVLTDEEGRRFTFNEDGTMQQSGHIARWDVGSKFAMRRHRAGLV